MSDKPPDRIAAFPDGQWVATAQSNRPMYLRATPEREAAGELREFASAIGRRDCEIRRLYPDTAKGIADCGKCGPCRASALDARIEKEEADAD